MRHRLPAFALATLLALAAASGAAVGAPPPAPERGLSLTVSGSDNTWIRGLALRCPPRADDHHPEAAGACAALDAADGDLDALPGGPRLCTPEYAPVSVTAEGTWDGRSVDWRRTFPNACRVDAATGPVFRF